MYLVQILLPLYDNNHCPLPREHYQRVRSDLMEHFQGLTAYTRAPAEGLWQEQKDHTSQDEIVIYEVMVPKLDPAWWRRYRKQLEKWFRQEMVVVRAQQMRLL